MAKMRKQPKRGRCDHDFSLEPGDRVFRKIGEKEYEIFDIRESRGRNKRESGELTYVSHERTAYKDERGTFYWNKGSR